MTNAASSQAVTRRRERRCRSNIIYRARCVAMSANVCEKITCDAVCAAIGPTDPPLDKSKKGAKKRGHGGHGGNGGDGGQGGSQGEAEDPASSIKSEYLERTSPPVKTLWFTFGLMGPYWSSFFLIFLVSIIIIATRKNATAHVWVDGAGLVIFFFFFLPSVKTLRFTFGLMGPGW